MKKKVLRERRALKTIVLGTETPKIEPYDPNAVMGVIEEAKPTKKRASKKKEA